MADLAVTVRDDGGVTQKDGVTTVQLDTTTPEVVAKAADRPAWLPEKFKSAEDLARSYGELEKKLGGTKTDTVIPPVSGAVPQVKTATDATTLIAAAGLDMGALRQEFASNGVLSDKTYTDLAAKNISRGDADAYIEGQKAIVREYTADLAGSIGGQPKLEAILAWAATGVDAKEITSINKTLTSGDAPLSKILLAGLQARYDAAMGTSPEFVNGESAAVASGLKPFANNDELYEAMHNPLYRTSAVYRASVEKRL